MLSEWDIEQIRDVVRQELLDMQAVDAMRECMKAKEALTAEVDALVRLVAEGVAHDVSIA